MRLSSSTLCSVWREMTVRALLALNIVAYAALGQFNDTTAHENNTSCDPEAPVGQLELSLCTVLPSSCLYSANKTVTVACCGRNNQTSITCYHDGGEMVDNVTSIHGVPTSLILNCFPDNTTVNYCCQFLQPKFGNNSKCSNSNTIKFSSSLTDICVYNKNDLVLELISNCSSFLCKDTSQPTKQDSTCIEPMLFYGVAGSLLLTNIMLLLVIMMFCAACLSHKKKLTQPYRKSDRMESVALWPTDDAHSRHSLADDDGLIDHTSGDS